MNGNRKHIKPRLLIVEDDTENQKYFELILNKTYELDYCESSISFYNLLADHNYSAIIMDIMLKGDKSGLDLIREIKRSVLYKDLPVLALSANVFSQDRAKALDAGADVYLTKPVNNRTLMSWLEKLINHQSNHKKRNNQQF